MTARAQDRHEKSARRIPFWVRWALVVAWILFIWSRSLFPGPASSSQSNFVAALLEPLFEALGIRDWSQMTFLVRKAAHFLEYTVLGALLALTREEESAWWPRALVGVATPSADETIQLFVPGRSGQVTDVMLDCAGAACGMALATGIRSALRRRRR